MATNLKNRAVALALQLLPQDMLAALPDTLEAIIREQLATVTLEEGEAGTMYLVVEAGNGVVINLVTADNECRPMRLIRQLTLKQLTEKLLETVRNGL